MEKKPIVKLRVYRGKTLSYNADGSIQNETQLISVEYKSKLWGITMKTLPISGYVKVVVESVFEPLKDGEYKKIEDVSKYTEEVNDAFTINTKVEKTADQLRIEALEAKIALLVDGKTEKKAAKKEKVEVSDDEKEEVATLREEYTALNDGKGPFPGWKADVLKEKIEALKADQK